jgi:hypothetical protein
MKPAPNSARFPLALEFIQGKKRESLLGPTATAASATYKKMPILHAQLSRITTRYRNLVDRAIGRHCSSDPVLSSKNNSKKAHNSLAGSLLGGS